MGPICLRRLVVRARYATKRGGSTAAAEPSDPNGEQEAEGEVPESEQIASYGEEHCMEGLLTIATPYFLQC